MFLVSIFTIVLLLTRPCELYAKESGFQFRHFSTDQGLSLATVQTQLYDSQGYLWIGTSDGLNRYDGYQFRKFRHDPDNKKSISNSNVLSLFEELCF